MSLGINASVLLKDRYLLSSGLEYHQLWSTFDSERSSPTQVFKEDQILKLWIDQNTGDTLKVERGDINRDAVFTRTIIHYNQYQRFSIPIEIGLQQQTQKIVYGITAGGILNFTFQQSGKTFDKDSAIVEFDKDSSARAFKPFSIGLRLSPFIGYRITDGWTLKIRPQWLWNPGTKFDGTAIKLNAHQFHLNLGLGYSF